MRRAFAGAAASLVVITTFACSSSPPDPPSSLQSASRNRGSRSGDTSEGSTPPTQTIQSADASTAPPDECKTVPPTNKCGLDPQCGCGLNETCDVTNEATGATSCVTGGAGTLGRPCNLTGDCIAGLTCAWGACRPFCSTPQTKCAAPGTELCVAIVGENGQPLPNLDVCTIACDPWDPKGVCGTNSCHWFEAAYKPFKVSDCNYPGPSTLHQSCELDDDCAAGLLCIGKTCERWCRIGTAGDCAQGYGCQDFFGADAPVIGGVKRGVCLK